MNIEMLGDGYFFASWFLAFDIIIDNQFLYLQWWCAPKMDHFLYVWEDNHRHQPNETSFFPIEHEEPICWALWLNLSLSSVLASCYSPICTNWPSRTCNIKIKILQTSLQIQLFILLTWKGTNQNLLYVESIRLSRNQFLLCQLSKPHFIQTHPKFYWL